MYKRYIARRRARFQSNSGQVNLPYGTKVECRDGFLFWNGLKLCAATSQNAKEFFVQDDDWLGQERAMLINAILARLGPHERRKGKAAGRWERVWADPLCQRYKRPEHENHWLWNEDFYNAPVDNLRHIAQLVDVKI